jgi:CRISPR-associated protein Cmr1
MKKITVTLRVITPLFLSGSNRVCGSNRVRPAEFRLASLKGALRFWFRAANYKNFALEQRLFGSTEIGLGCFMMRAKPLVQNTKDDFGAPYLLGQGLYKMKKGPSRCYIEPGKNIEIVFLFNSAACDNAIQKVLETIFLFTHLGGLGARSRRGLGSLIVDKQEGDFDNEILKPANSTASFIEKLSTIVSAKIKEDTSNIPDYTAFSRKSRILVLDKLPQANNTDWKKCLEWLNNKFMFFRSFETKRFSRDTKLMLNFIKTGGLDRAPARAVFGLPHNYFFRDFSPKRGSVQTAGIRRASPLFFHVHQLPAGQFVPVISFLPAVFLPEGAPITYKNDIYEASVNPPDSFEPIEMFLNEMSQYGHEINDGVDCNGGGKK